MGIKKVKYLSGTKKVSNNYINDKHKQAMKAKIDGKEKQIK